MKLVLINTAFVLLVSTPVLSQCLSGAQFADTLYSIENSDATDLAKLQGLQHLHEWYIKCKGARDSVYARIVHRLGNFYRLTGDIEKGINYTKEAINTNSAPVKGTDKLFLVNSYFNLGMCYWQQNLHSQGRYYFDSCIYLAIRYPSKYNILFLAFEKEAYSFFQTGDYQKSIETADNGILWAIKAKDSLYEAILLSQKAQSQLELNNIIDAEKNIRRTIAILKNNQGGIYYLAAGYSVYADLLMKKNDPKTAIHFYESSFQLNKKNGELVQCARDMLNLGFLYDDLLHDNLKAIACYQKGIQIVEQTNAVSELLGLYINMGVVYWRQKNYKRALYFYQKGLNVLPINFSDTSVERNPSVDMLKPVTNDYYVATLLANKAEAFLDQYKMEKRKGLLSAALSTFEVADKTIDLMRWKQYGEQSKLFWRQKTKNIYEKAIEVCYLLKDAEKAFYFFEKSRAVLLSDKLSELGAKRFLSGSDRSKEQSLNLKVLSLNQQLSSLGESSISYNNTKHQLLSAQEELEKFIKNLEEKYPIYYKYKYDNTVYPLTVVRNKLLADSQSLVEYFTGDSSVYILSVSHTGDNFLKVSLKDYSSTSTELMQLCSDKSSLNQNYSRYRSLAYQFYEKLFKPLNIPEGRVIISPDGNFIPFEALLSDANDPTSFLLKKHAFSYTYSIGLLTKNTNNYTSAGNSFLGVAPVNYQPYLGQQSLEGADQSLNNIKPYFPSGTFLIKQDATKNQFLKSLSLYNIVQIYSHADADSSHTEPVLYLRDSSINISEIQSLDNLKTSMIVLSACRTGIGKNARGEGVFSLARAFTAAGISSTITTLWQIDNRATYQLTENFYKYLSNGLPKDVALQKAKLEFLVSNDKTYELPYYWAGDILLGRTDTIQKNATSSRFGFAFIVIISILLSIAVIIVYKKIAQTKKF